MTDETKKNRCDIMGRQFTSNHCVLKLGRTINTSCVLFFKQQILTQGFLALLCPRWPWAKKPTVIIKYSHRQICTVFFTTKTRLVRAIHTNVGSHAARLQRTQFGFACFAIHITVSSDLFPFAEKRCVHKALHHSRSLCSWSPAALTRCCRNRR